MWLSTASRRCRSLPMRETSTCSGTFPLRNPGTLTVAERSEVACSTACSNSCGDTSTVKRTLLSGSSSTRAAIGGHRSRAPMGYRGAMQVGPRVLGLEDATERRRAGAVHGAGASGPLTLEDAARAASACTERAARDFLDALVALGHAGARATASTPTRRRPICTSIGASRRTSAACWRWRTHRLYRFWGGLTEGLRTGAAAERGQAGRRPSSRRCTATRRGSSSSWPAMTGLSQRRRNHAMAAQVPVGRVPDLRRRRRAPRASLPVQLALAHPHLTGVGFDLPAVGADLRGVRRAASACRTG